MKGVHMIELVNSWRFKKSKKIKDLRMFESAFTVPWAYDIDTRKLDENYSVSDQGGTCQLAVPKTLFGYSLLLHSDYEWN
jgi:hypothetical protein